MLTKNHKSISLVIKSIFIFLFFFLATFVFLNRQYITDKFTVWRFVPAAGVLDLVDRAGMNDNGKFFYLASQPRLDSADDFNNNCQRSETTASILGCYSDGIIYIYNVTDPKLDGIREVTAVHETLHAVYSRLSDNEKTKINPLLESEFKKLSSDSNFMDRMAFYERTEVGQRYNELYSVVGSEVSSVSPELESYYNRYFSDRQKAVNLNKKYITVFKTIQDQANTLKSEMEIISTDITSRTNQYDSDIEKLNSDIQKFNEDAKNNVFLSQDQFNNERSRLVNRIKAAESSRDYINNEVKQYNSISDRYSSLAVQSQNLYKSIDSNLTPAPSI